METDFPRSLGHLTININATLADPQLRKDREYHCNPEVLSVQLARESLECLIALKSGDVLIYRLLPQNEVQHPTTEVDERIVLFDAEMTCNSKFRPYMMLRRRPTQVTSCSLCDIGGSAFHSVLRTNYPPGFLAVGYSDGTVVVIDLRGPSILHVPQTDHPRKVHSHNSRESSETGEIVSLTWTISGLHSGEINLQFTKTTLTSIRSAPRREVDRRTCIWGILRLQTNASSRIIVVLGHRRRHHGFPSQIAS